MPVQQSPFATTEERLTVFHEEALVIETQLKASLEAALLRELGRQQGLIATWAAQQHDPAKCALSAALLEAAAVVTGLGDLRGTPEYTAFIAGCGEPPPKLLSRGDAKAVLGFVEGVQRRFSLEAAHRAATARARREVSAPRRAQQLATPGYVAVFVRAWHSYNRPPQRARTMLPK